MEEPAGENTFTSCFAVCGGLTSLRSNSAGSAITYSQQIASPGRCQKRRQPRRTKRGSRKGYNGDVDFSEEDEDEVTTTESTNRLRFYTHVRPRRRNDYDIRTKKHGRKQRRTPDTIDLSLAPLVSSKEFDRRFGIHLHGSFDGFSCSSSLPSSGTNSDSSSSSSTGSGRESRIVDQVSDDIIKNKRKYNCLASSGPLAVVDYGSIELDMAGSFLGSIYNIGGSASGRRSTDLQIGGQRFSLNDGSKRKKHRPREPIEEETCNNRQKAGMEASKPA